MRTIKLILEYDGTHYGGFQRQPNANTIQAELEEALRRVTGDPLLRIGGAAGRTDAGVHARGQVVHFQTESRVPTDRWPYALNQHLPPDIAVVGAEEAPEGFHARYWARAKRYRYTLYCGPFPSPLARLYAYHWSRPVDPAPMKAAAWLLTGRHDFAAFRSTGGAAKTSVRTIYQVQVAAAAPYIYIDVTADGFLYNMVRIIAGTLLEVGAGQRSLDEVREALETGQRDLAGRTLPPHGLCLEAVEYGDGPKRLAWLRSPADG